MIKIIKCESQTYVRDRGYVTCELPRDHSGDHEYRILVWWK